ncbi:acyl carrier protein [bacterium]|jgi:acyl carrier protein|nr:acyl carrier protein [bacterium]
MTIKEKIYEIVARKLKTDASLIPEDANLKKELGADSIDTVEIVFEIEEEYKIAVPDELAETINTINDAVSVVEKLVGNN